MFESRICSATSPLLEILVSTICLSCCFLFRIFLFIFVIEILVAPSIRGKQQIKQGNLTCSVKLLFVVDNFRDDETFLISDESSKKKISDQFFSSWKDDRKSIDSRHFSSDDLIYQANRVDSLKNQLNHSESIVRPIDKNLCSDASLLELLTNEKIVKRPWKLS